MRRLPLILLALLTVGIRLPFWFVDVIDWDESTFILMGQAWADGHLPYTTLWDNKPPLCFAPFALLSILFGKSIVAVRIFGALWVYLTALLVCRIGTRMHSPLAGEISGAFTILLVTFASRGQATMSETVALLPLVAGVESYLTRSKHSGAFWAGLCLSVAALVRLNLALVAAALLGVMLFEALTQRDTRRLVRFVLGGATPLVVFCAIYLQAKALDTFLLAVFVAPFAYALTSLGLAALPSTAGLAIVAPLGLNDLRFWTVSLSVVASILLSGGGAAHYWIQVHPFSGLVLGFVIASFLRYSRRELIAWVAVLIAIPGFAALSDASLWSEYRRFDFTVKGRATELATYLDGHDARGAPVLFLADHIAHWWLDSRPLHRMATHPSSLFRSELIRVAEGPQATPESVLQEILDGRPLYVVRGRYVRHLDRSPAAAALLEERLRRDYVLEKRMDELLIYRSRP